MSNGKNPYPGVTVLKANEHHPRRARWVDPDTGRKRVHALPADEREAEQWLLKKSAELMLRRARTDPPPGEFLSVALAKAKYLQQMHRLRPGTLAQYKLSLGRLEAFLGGRAPTKALLTQWRASLDQPGVAVATVNRDLAHASAFLHHARRAGDLPLGRDDIADGLKRLASDHEKKEPLTVEELRELVASLPAGEYRTFVLVLLLTGMRFMEVVRLHPRQIRNSAIHLGRETKTKQGRMIDLSISPACIKLLNGFKGWTLTLHQLRYYREKLHPGFTYQRLRVTCGTYLTCAPGIYGGASAYMSASRLGHSVQIAEKHYVRAVHVPPDAKTLEAAMGIADLLHPKK